MPYIKRNSNGEIIAIFENSSPDAQEYLSIEDEELVRFIAISSNHDDVKALLLSSDSSLIRVLEDLINTLINNKVILFTDLPSAAQEKLANREKIRGNLSSLDNLMGEDEGIL